MYFVLVTALFYCIYPCTEAGIVSPDYWFGKIPTSNNGSTDVQTPFFIESNVYRYYRIGRDDAAVDTVRDTLNDPTRRAITKANRPPTNVAPENVTGTVSLHFYILSK